MANAATRAKAQANVSKVKPLSRAELLEKLKECDRPVLVAHVKANGLPKSTAEWSDAMLIDALNACHPLITGGKEAPLTGGSATTEPVDIVMEESETATEPEDLVKTPAPMPEAPKAAPKTARQIHQPPPHPAYAIVHETDDEATTKVHEFKTWDQAVEFVNAIPEGSTAYAVRRLEDMKPVPMAILLAVTNKTAQTPIKKFANPDAARESAFNALPNASAETAVKPKKTAAKSATPAAPRARKPVSYPAKAEAKPVRAGSKVANLIDLLARPTGASMDEIETELSKSGKAVNGRSWLGYDLVQKGYGAQEREDGRIVLVLPAGMTAPHPHLTAGSGDTMVGVTEAEGPYTNVEAVPEVIPAKKTATKTAAKKAPAAAKKATAKKTAAK